MGHPTEIRLYERSMLFYWWPIWAIGFLIGLITYLDGGIFVHAGDGAAIRVLRGSAPGILYISVLLLTIFMTSVRMKGVVPVLILVSVIVGFLSLAWMGTLNVFTTIIPRVSVHVTSGFYIVSSSALLLLWGLVVFGTDRLSYWRIKEGQLTRVRLVGANEFSFNISELKVEHQTTDLIRHLIFGFGSGDFLITLTGNSPVPIEIRNVLNAQKKLKAIHELGADSLSVRDGIVAVSEASEADVNEPVSEAVMAEPGKPV